MVNDRPEIDLNTQNPRIVAMDPFEVIEVETRKTSCDGGGGALGHPRVYLTVGAGETEIVCPYCSRTYRLKAGAEAASHGH